jgi:hypothetical protein
MVLNLHPGAEPNLAFENLDLFLVADRVFTACPVVGGNLYLRVSELPGMAGLNNGG